MAEPIRGPASSSMIIFNSSPSSSTAFLGRHNDYIFLPCNNGPGSLTGFVKRGRPKKERQKCSLEEFDEASQGNGNSSASKLSFITYTSSPKDATPDLRRLVRRRAMLNYRREERQKKKGVSEGEENSWVTRLFHQQTNNDEEGTRQYVADDPTLELPASTTELLPKEITAIDPFNAFPIKIEPYMLDLLLFYTTSIYQTMYTIERHVNLNPSRDYWLPMAFQDPALLHAFLFCADGHGTIAQGRKERPAAVIHLRKSIQIVNEMLQEPVPKITDATIAVVCTFAHTEIFNGNYENWRLHMRGLVQMVRHRGGIQTFESNRLLRSKINRINLCLSKPFDLATKELPTITGYDQMMTAMTFKFSRLPNSVKLDEALLGILCEVQGITFHLSTFYRKSPQSQIHPMSLREAIASSQYSLLSFKHRRSHSTHEGLTHEILQLTLLIYLGTVLNESPPGVSIYDMTGAKLKSNLSDIQSHGSLNLHFSLWIMFLAATMVKDPDTKGYFMGSINDIVEELGVRDWDSIQALFKSFFWVENVHGKTFKLIWNVIQSL